MVFNNLRLLVEQAKTNYVLQLKIKLDLKSPNLVVYIEKGVGHAPGIWKEKENKPSLEEGLYKTARCVYGSLYSHNITFPIDVKAIKSQAQEQSIVLNVGEKSCSGWQYNVI